MQNNDKAALESVFKSLELKQAEERARRLAELEKELDALEQDLSILALSAEMAK